MAGREGTALRPLPVSAHLQSLLQRTILPPTSQLHRELPEDISVSYMPAQRLERSRCSVSVT